MRRATALKTHVFLLSSHGPQPIESLCRQGEDNVLWQMHPHGETADAFHFGADISMLSQFPLEAEVLFPPSTMLVVRPRVEPREGQPHAARPGATRDDRGAAQRSSADTTADFEVRSGFDCHEVWHGDKRYLLMHVEPSFI
jgi:hypothetical protein